MPSASDCVFCAILEARAPSSPVYEDDRCVAFMDIHPAAPGHLLVVPREHATHIEELPEPLRAHLFLVATRLLAALRGARECEGGNLVVNDGPAAGQTVPHVHLHVIPRVRGDSSRVLIRLLSHRVRFLNRSAPRPMLDALARRFREVLAGR